MSAYSRWGAFEIGLIFGLVALGVLISFRILNFPDLTVDGSFPLGGATAAILIHHGVDPFLASVCATLAGGVAGMITGWLNRSEEHTSALQSLMRISYAVFCLKKKNSESKATD